MSTIATANGRPDSRASEAATVASRGVVAPQLSAELLSKLAQHPVPLQVPEAVVDLLEVVDVEHQRGKRRVLAL